MPATPNFLSPFQQRALHRLRTASGGGNHNASDIVAFVLVNKGHEATQARPAAVKEIALYRNMAPEPVPDCRSRAIGGVV